MCRDLLEVFDLWSKIHFLLNAQNKLQTFNELYGTWIINVKGVSMQYGTVIRFGNKENKGCLYKIICYENIKTMVWNIWFLSPLVLTKQFVYFLRKVCLFFNFWIHNYVKQNIIENFIIKKLKNKHTFLKKYTNWAKLSSLEERNIVCNIILFNSSECFLFSCLT